MFVKQIDEKTALELHASGNEILVLIPDKDGNWEDMIPDTLKNMLDGAMFFRREPALEKPVLESKQAPTSPKGKRKEIDTRKLLALHKAGLSNLEIADELGVCDVTVEKYLRTMEEK